MRRQTRTRERENGQIARRRAARGEWKLREGEPHALIRKLQAAKPFPAAERTLTLDGVRAEYADGFGLARVSNTTPVIVLRFEADTDAALARIQEEFRAALQHLRRAAPLPFSPTFADSRG